MILLEREILDLIRSGHIQADPHQVEATHLDVTLSSVGYFEGTGKTVRLDEDEQINLIESRDMVLNPNAFGQFQLVEKITLPSNISAEYFLDSSLARKGLEHSSASRIFPGWSGYLTLELKNLLERHTLTLTHGMNIGKIIFYKHGSTTSYKGRYQDQEDVV